MIRTQGQQLCSHCVARNPSLHFKAPRERHRTVQKPWARARRRGWLLFLHRTFYFPRKCHSLQVIFPRRMIFYNSSRETLGKGKQGIQGFPNQKTSSSQVYLEHTGGKSGQRNASRNDSPKPGDPRDEPDRHGAQTTSPCLVHYPSFWGLTHYIVQRVVDFLIDHIHSRGKSQNVYTTAVCFMAPLVHYDTFMSFAWLRILPLKAQPVSLPSWLGLGPMGRKDNVPTPSQSPKR